jgi:hypothetical protein
MFRRQRQNLGEDGKGGQNRTRGEHTSLIRSTHYIGDGRGGVDPPILDNNASDNFGFFSCFWIESAFCRFVLCYFLPSFVPRVRYLPSAAAISQDTAVLQEAID